MKILQINKYSSLKGGTERVLFDTIKLLESDNHEIILFSTDEGELVHTPTYTINYPKSNDSFLHKIKNVKSFFFNKKVARILQELINREQPDIAHIHLYLNGLSSSILQVLKNNNIPIVMTLHEYRQICPSYLLLDRNNDICEKCIGGKFYNCMFSRCAQNSLIKSTMLTFEMYYRRYFFRPEDYVDKFICVSQFIYDKHKKFNTSIAKKSIVLYNSVMEHLEVTPCCDKDNYILYYGRLSREKGIETLLSVMQLLPVYSLKVVGGGDLSFNNIPSNVEMLGFKSGNELSCLVQKAKYVIVPSEWFETFGLTCVESLALGTPVIASDIGALPEIITHNENGFLFESGNIFSLMNVIKHAMSLDEPEYEQLCLMAKKSSSHFSEEKYLQGLLNIYNELVNK